MCKKHSDLPGYVSDFVTLFIARLTPMLTSMDSDECPAYLLSASWILTITEYDLNHVVGLSINTGAFAHNHPTASLILQTLRNISDWTPHFRVVIENLDI